MNSLLKLVFSCTALVVSACGNMPSTADSGGQVPSVAVAPPATGTEAAPSAQAASVPEVELTEDILYGVLAGELAGQRGRLDIAMRQYLYAARLSGDPRIAERASRIAIYAKDDAGARSALELLTELQPDNLEAQMLTGVLNIRLGLADEAVERFEQVLALTPEGEGKAFLTISQVLSKEQMSPIMVVVTNRLRDAHSAVPEAHYVVGFLAAQRGDLAPARDSLARALELRPDWPGAVTLYARVMIRLGEPEKARALLSESVEKHPDNFALRMSYAQVLVQIDHAPQAREQFRILLEQRPDEPDILFALGLLSVQLEDMDQARNYFELLYEHDSRKSDAAHYLGQIDETAGSLDQAIDWYEQVRSGPHILDARIRRAMLLAQLGRVDEARNDLRSLHSRLPKHLRRLYMAEGEVMREVGDYAAAVELYDEALGVFPDDSELLYARGLTAEKIGRIDILERDLKVIIAAEPENAHALNALGYTLADRTDRYVEAREYIERAYALMPDSAAVIDSLGWLEFREGNLEAAMKHLEAAIAIEYDGEIAAHLVEVLRASGNTEKADRILERALIDFPENKILLEVAGRHD